MSRRETRPWLKADVLKEVEMKYMVKREAKCEHEREIIKDGNLGLWRIPSLQFQIFIRFSYPSSS